MGRRRRSGGEALSEASSPSEEKCKCIEIREEYIYKEHKTKINTY